MGWGGSEKKLDKDRFRKDLGNIIQAYQEVAKRLGIHHLALEVDNIEESLAKAKKNGLEPIGEAPRPGADNTLVAFFHPKDTGGVLLEIVQEKN